MTLTEFLLARIAEDEAVAQAAVIPAHDGFRPHPELSRWQYAPWSPQGSGEVEYVQTPEMLAHKYPERLYATCDSEGLSPSVGEDVGPHIARHDPARVLAECEAKRRIVKRHAIADSVRLVGTDEKVYVCITCRLDDEPPAGTFAYPCSTLRALAAVYADHPDYDETWRP